jgi:hypothetical protein
MPYQIVNNVTNEALNTALGINLPFTGQFGVFNSTYTTEARALANLKNLLLTYKGERIFSQILVLIYLRYCLNQIRKN